MKNTILPLLLTTTFAACTSTGTDTSISQAPTSSGGYAGSAGNADPEAITLTASAPLIRGVVVEGVKNSSAEEVSITISNQQFIDGELNSVDLTLTGGDSNVEGNTITLTWNEDNQRFEAIADGINYSLHHNYDQIGNWSSTDRSLSVAHVNVWGNGLYTDENGDALGGSYHGRILIGFNTAPDDVAARNDMATYIGNGQLDVARANVGNVGAYGTATLNADFTAGTISGRIDNLTNFDSNPDGYDIADGAVVTIEQANIDGNAFAVDISIDAADFGLSANDDITGLGQFYGEDAANVGGTFSGAGTDSTDDGTVFITGSFGAQEQQE